MRVRRDRREVYVHVVGDAGGEKRWGLGRIFRL